MSSEGSLFADIPKTDSVCPEVAEALRDEKRLKKLLKEDMVHILDNISYEEEPDDDLEESDGDSEASEESHRTQSVSEASLIESCVEQDSHQEYPQSSVFEHYADRNRLKDDSRVYTNFSGCEERSDAFYDKQKYVRTVHESSEDSDLPENSVYASSGNQNELEMKSPAKQTSSELSDIQLDLQQENDKLKVLHSTVWDELKRVKRDQIDYEKKKEKEIETLKYTMAQLEDDKRHLSYRLHESDELVSEYKAEKNNWVGNYNSLERQLSSMTAAKDEVCNKLESAQVTINSLEKQLNELNRSGNLPRLRDQHDKILEEMKLRHQKETLSLKEQLDDIHVKFGEKDRDYISLKDEFVLLHQKYEQLRIEKTEAVQKMNRELEQSELRVREYLESDTSKEVGKLKLQVQYLEEQKTNLENENWKLKEEIKSLKAELATSETLQKLAFSTKKRGETEEEKRTKELSLQGELEKSLKNVRSLRQERLNLMKQLEVVQNQLKLSEKESKSFESQFIESEEKIKELEEKIKSISSNETVSNEKHEQETKDLESELIDLKHKFRDLRARLKEASNNEKIFYKNNEDLKKTVAEMRQKHADEKIKAIEECRVKCMSFHESTLEKAKLEILAKGAADLGATSANYENKIAKLEKEIKDLNDRLFDSQKRYLEAYNENKNLQEKFHEFSIPKERTEIEKDIRSEYERKFSHLKDLLIKRKDEYMAGCLKTEVEKAQVEWTNEKMVHIKAFVENTKQRLEERFKNCLEKERCAVQEKLNTAKEKFHKEYEKNIQDQKNQYEAERGRLAENLSKTLQRKWEAEIALLKDRQESEIKFINHQFESKILSMEKEIQHLRENLSSKTREDVIKVRDEFIIQKEIWEAEKAQLKSLENTLKESLKSSAENEKTLQEKIKKYQRHITALDKRYKDKMRKLHDQLSEVQKSNDEKEAQLLSIREKYDREIVNLGDKFKKHHNLCRSSETQTVEKMVSKQEYLDFQEKFFTCLGNISDAVGRYLKEAPKRHAESLHSALTRYHKNMSSRMFQDLSHDIHSFAPTIIVPRINTSKDTESVLKKTSAPSSNAGNLQEAKFKTSTPCVLSSFGNQFEPRTHLLADNNGLSSDDKYVFPSSISNQTRVKSVFTSKFKENAQSCDGVQSYYNSTNRTTTPPTLDALGADGNHVARKEFMGKTENGIFTGNRIKDDEYSVKFDDISFDFFPPLTDPGGLFNVNKQSGYRLKTKDIDGDGYFRDSVPVKLFSNCNL